MNKKSQAAMEFLRDYGWAILVVMVVIGALAYFGALHPINLKCGNTDWNDFCHIQYKAEHSKIFDEDLHEWNCEEVIGTICKGASTKYIDDKAYAIFSPKPFCSLCTSFWEECQVDEEAKQRFEEECECLYKERNCTFEVHSEEVISLGYLNKLCNFNVFNYNTISIPYKDPCFYLWEIRDKIGGWHCLKQKSYMKISDDLFIHNWNGKTQNITATFYTDKCLSAREKEKELTEEELEMIKCPEDERCRNICVLHDETRISIPYTTEEEFLKKCKNLYEEHYCIQNPIDEERCECVEWKMLYSGTQLVDALTGEESCVTGWKSFITDMNELGCKKRICTKAIPK